MALDISYWAASDELPLLETTCGGVLAAAAAARPDACALVDADSPAGARERWTYAELHQIAERTARSLLTRFDPGDHIAVWAANDPRWIFLQFGLALAGMVLVTVNPAYRASELAYVLRQSRARGLFHQAAYRGLDMGAAVVEARTESGVEVEHVLCFEAFDDFLAEGADKLSLPVVRPADVAMIQYTSGTTGRPKGALLNHHSITNNARMMAVLKGQNPNTVNLSVAPLFHTGGCVGSVLGTVQTGGCTVLPSAFDAGSMLDLVEQERVTYTFAVPTMLVAMLSAQSAQARDLSSLEVVFSGGATVPVDIVQRVEAVFAATLIIGYGQTETSPAITHTRLDDNPEDKSETIGYALPQVEIKIVDPTTGATQAVGTAGELCTRGFLVMVGYHDMPEETASTIDADGWLHTGDLCTMDERGYYRITGRLKDMVIRGGENIYPREIEEILYTHPAVSEAAIVGVPDDYWGERLAAVVSLEAGAGVTREDLRALIAGQLARHKVPADWYVLEAMPCTASGKIQKFRLVDQIADAALVELL